MRPLRVANRRWLTDRVPPKVSSEGGLPRRSTLEIHQGDLPGVSLRGSAEGSRPMGFAQEGSPKSGPAWRVAQGESPKGGRPKVFGHGRSPNVGRPRGVLQRGFLKGALYWCPQGLSPNGCPPIGVSQGVSPRWDPPTAFPKEFHKGVPQGCPQSVSPKRDPQLGQP